MRYFQGRLCSKTESSCGKLCNFSTLLDSCQKKTVTFFCPQMFVPIKMVLNSKQSKEISPKMPYYMNNKSALLQNNMTADHASANSHSIIFTTKHNSFQDFSQILILSAVLN